MSLQKKELAARFEKIFLYGFVSTLLLPIKFNLIFVYLMATVWLYLGRYRDFYRQFKNSKPFFTLMVFYLVLALSLFYSKDLTAGLKALETKLPLVFVPLFIATIPWSISLRNNIIRTYIISCVIISIYSIISTIIVYDIESNELNYFSFTLPNTVGLNSTYYAIYIVFALFFLVNGIFEFQLFPKWLTISLSIYLMIFLHLIGSRTPVGLFIICVTGYLVYLIFSKKYRRHRKLAVWTLTITSVTVTLAVLYIPYLNSRVLQVFQNFSKDPRYYIHQSCFNIIKEHPITGVGIGDYQQELRHQFEKMGFAEGLKKNYNPHNDWLCTYLSSGIFGIIAFATMFGVLIVRTFKEPSFISSSFLVFFLFATQTECIFNRNKGITLFSLMVTMIFILKLFNEREVKTAHV